MTDTEQPSQWAVELIAVLANMDSRSDAALKLQRAFAEREAELVGALRHVTECLVAEMGNLANEDENPDEDLAPVVGVKYARQVIAARLRIRQARAALKSREAGHG